MSGRVSDPRLPSALREHELLARLGLGPGASNDEVEAAHDEILGYLAKAPGSLRGWARVQVTDADEAYARLNGAPPSASYDEPISSSTTVPAAALLSAPRVTEGRLAGPTIRGGIDDEFDEFFDEPGDGDGPVVITRRDRRHAQAAQATRQNAVRVRPQTADGIVIGRSSLRPLAAIGAIVVIVVGAIGIYGFGSSGLPGINGTPAPAASGGLDTAAVAADMAKIAANPNDTATLMDLANLYYQSSDYTTAETWLQKILAIDPKNVDALLALGASNFNSGDNADAQTAWEQVLTIDSKNVEAYYDLGFMYYSQNPPNLAKVREDWGKVVALAPDSDIAQTVQTHLAQLGGSPLPSDATGSPSGSSVPAASQSPASSPAPSSVPSPAAS